MDTSSTLLDWLTVAFYISFAGFVIWQVMTRTNR